ncbi:MAG: GNAT family N-acetyltransferase [Rothia sp. (in: high G+C Gram-positive bacteria)]|nr:GNAT family N-acetyltransferase [Rothia sp. (in: high G+C Gram-positive bacteria)]
MTYTFITGEVPSQAELVELYTAVGWSAYTDQPENLIPMCQGSLYLAVAREEHSGRLAGLVRAVGDGVSISYIQDLLVHPDFQKKGVGAHLLDAALEAVGGVRQVYITTDTHASNQHVIDLYTGRGFKAVGDYGCVTLARFS